MGPGVESKRRHEQPGEKKPKKVTQPAEAAADVFRFRSVRRVSRCLRPRIFFSICLFVRASDSHRPRPKKTFNVSILRPISPARRLEPLPQQSRTCVQKRKKKQTIRM
eukprot:GFKZ01013836.1.p2 GENE.GFKZ01013836.1~~GFKZ01013836.1.p2  ORF type:complete len:108 (-),score=0.59 GFKZ01013836.1:246-569(-)